MKKCINCKEKNKKNLFEIKNLKTRQKVIVCEYCINEARGDFLEWFFPAMYEEQCRKDEEETEERESQEGFNLENYFLGSLQTL